MMKPVRVVVAYSYIPYDHAYITHLGFDFSDKLWTVEEVIEAIEKKRQSFYLIDPYSGHRCELAVIHPLGRPLYLRGRTDQGWNDSLLRITRAPDQQQVIG